MFCVLMKVFDMRRCVVNRSLLVCAIILGFSLVSVSGRFPRRLGARQDHFPPRKQVLNEARWNATIMKFISNINFHYYDK